MAEIESWRSKAVAQDVVYPDREHLGRVLGQLRELPGLVTDVEIDRLREQYARIADGQAFLLQCGDCAELFSYCNPTQIDAKLKLTLLMSLIVIYGARLPVVRVGRIAGQHAKPRSKPTEKVRVDGEEREVLSFRGDNVNGIGLEERTPNPDRLLSAYFHSAATLNYIRSRLASGLADLHAPRSWSFQHVRSEYLQHEFERIADSISDTLDFIRTVGAEPGGAQASNTLNTVDYFTSHEALMLEYETVLTRETPRGVYDLSAHTVWLGDRTRQLDGAHVEFFRRIRNPIGVKVGPSMKPDELVQLLDTLNPEAEKGRVTLISRYGARKITELLPAHIRAVRASRHADAVIWCCDPMHGNTVPSPGNPAVKTRLFSDIVTELAASLRIHAAEGSRLGGMHLELTGDDGVTECVGGSMELSDADLARKYQTHCDPRLNYEQSLDIAFLVSEVLRARRLGHPHSENDALVHALARSTEPAAEGK